MSDKNRPTLTLGGNNSAEEDSRLASSGDSRLAGPGFANGPQNNEGRTQSDRLSADVRTSKDPGTDHRDADMDSRSVTENRQISDAERVEAFRMAHFQFALPDLPKIPGYHVCWCTTTNPRDTIQMRTRLGYELVRGHDIPGWNGTAIKGGQFDGCIGVNEMIAMKLPLRLYELFMTEAHHNQPNFEQDKLNIAMQEAAAQAAAAKAAIEEEGGTAALKQKVRAPRFTDNEGREAFIPTVPITNTISRS